MADRRKEPQPLWTDPDDFISDKEGLSIKHPKYEARANGLFRDRLVEQFEAIHGRPQWAEPKAKRNVEAESSDDSGDEAEEKDGTRKKMRYSGRNTQLKFNRLANLNMDEIAGVCNDGTDIIHSLKFHPHSCIALVGDSRNRVSFYRVDAAQRSRVGFFEVQTNRVCSAVFSADGEEVYVTVGQGHFWVYDMRSGVLTKVNPDAKYNREAIKRIVIGPNNDVFFALTLSSVRVHSRQSKEVIASLFADQAEGITFDPAGNIIVATSLGAIYKYDGKTYTCNDVSRSAAVDSVTCVAYSKVNDALFLGTSSGIVNVKPYSPVGDTPSPTIKDIKNLRTGITSIVSNHTQEIIAFASMHTQNAVRLYDVQRAAVVPNFPTLEFVGRVNSLDISPHSGFLGVGNNRGQAILYRLDNYDGY